MFSAVKHKGKKLYELARKGQTVERKPRRVTIYNIKPLCYIPQTQRFLFDVECSKGTYIRSLAAQLGEKIGCGAHLTFLLRTKVGNFNIAEAYTIKELEHFAAMETLNDVLDPIDKALDHLPLVVACREAVPHFLNGIPLKEEQLQKPLPDLNNQLVRIYDPGHKFLAIAQVTNSDSELLVKPTKVFA